MGIIRHYALRERTNIRCYTDLTIRHYADRGVMYIRQHLENRADYASLCISRCDVYTTTCGKQVLQGMTLYRLKNNDYRTFWAPDLRIKVLENKIQRSNCLIDLFLWKVWQKQHN